MHLGLRTGPLWETAALGIQQAKHMLRIVIDGQSRSTTFFHIISQTARLPNKKKVIEYKMCVLIFSTTSVSNFSHSKKNWGRYDQKMYIDLHVKYPLLLSDFNETLNFLDRFSKNIQISSDLCLRNMGIERSHNSEIISLWEENIKKNIWAHKRKPNLESQNQWRIR